MASLTVEQSFPVDAPPKQVWRHLTDPALVVTCLPGAALLSSSEDGRTHDGTVTVKLGTISVSYRGRAEFVEVDEERRRFRVLAKGQEKLGAGSAEMAVTAAVLAAGEGSEVSIEADVHVTGKLVTLGRGMIGVVSEQLVKDFATSLREKVSVSPAHQEAGGRTASDTAEPAAREPDEAAAPKPASALSILFRAIWSRISRLFGRD